MHGHLRILRMVAVYYRAQISLCLCLTLGFLLNPQLKTFAFAPNWRKGIFASKPLLG